MRSISERDCSQKYEHKKIISLLSINAITLLTLIATINSESLLAEGKTVRANVNLDEIQVTNFDYKKLGLNKADFTQLKNFIKLKMYDLSMCESGRNNMAVNPKDKDGTQSWYCYQFKPDTWKMYVKKYDMWNWREWEEADYWNTMNSIEHNDEVVFRMFLDKDVDLQWEFPSCSKKYRLKHNYSPFKN